MGNPWTPGPWRYERDFDYYYIGPKGRGDAVVGGKDNREGNEADYALIAEAPAMAEALSVLVEHYVALAGSGDCGRWDPEKEPEVMAARAILARIKGATP